jgi:glycosyltransferase involved in cell wall biosynthesis
MVHAKRQIYRCYTDVIAASTASAQDFAKVFGDPGPRVTVQALGVAAGATRDGSAHPDAPIVAVGRLHPSKGYDVLIRAVADLAPRRRLVIHGEGPERSSLEALARELGVDLNLPGTASLESVRAEVLPTAAALVVPSRSEAFGLIAIEGLAAGVPVVASDVGGLSEVIREGVGGHLVPVGEPGALAQRLALVLEPDTNDQMGRAAHQEFSSRFELRRRTEEIAQHLLAGE